MCGIIGYVGERNAKDLLLQGLERLEYRGYDSAGICLLEAGEADYVRAVGNLAQLREAAGANGSQATTGVGHTRWATHGRVSEANAHPLTNEDESVAVVLNGIVENFRELRASLEADGHQFTSETDAEVVAHLVERHYDGDLIAAVRAAYADLEGHYAFVVAHQEQPGLLVGARLQCPLVVGIGEGETFFASSIAAFLRETRRVKLIEDGEVVAITRAGARFFDLAGDEVEREETDVDWDDEAAEKQGYETFMLKEINEQPDAVAETIGERIRHGELLLEDIGLTDLEIQNLRRMVVISCGTSYHAGLVGRYVVEEWARVPCEPDIASEWRYRNPVLTRDTLVVGISQSGETADTIAAMRLAREKGARTLAITNMMGTQITREVDSTLYTRAGIEMGVAATKTFTSQVTLMYLLALRLAEVRRTLPPEQLRALLDEVEALPSKIATYLSGDHPIDEIAASPLPEAVLPLPRAPHRPSGLPRGRAEAEGDLLHPDGGVLRRRDEARPDRAARRHDAGRLHRNRLGRLRQGRVEHPGDAGARRGRDRDRDRRQRGHPAPRLRRDLHPAHAPVPPGGARRDPAPAPRLPDRAAQGPERRPAAESREDRHRRVARRATARRAADGGAGREGSSSPDGSTQGARQRAAQGVPNRAQP